MFAGRGAANDGDPAACPPGTQVLTKDGKRAPLLVCSPSPGFLDTKEKRLDEVCRNGAVFLMFDSDQYSGPCYDKANGHSIPSTREEHAEAVSSWRGGSRRSIPRC